MTDGAVEVHRLRLVGDASALKAGLDQGGRALVGFNTLVGRTDKELKRAEKAIDKAGTAMGKSAALSARMKESIRTLTREVTRSHREATVLSAKLTRATRTMNEHKAVVAAQKAVIKSLVKTNLQLADSYDRVTQSGKRATATTRSGFKPISQQFANATPLGVNALGQVTPGGLTSLKALNTGLTNTAKAGNAAAKGVYNAQRAYDFSEGGMNALRYQLYGVTAAYGILGAAVFQTSGALIRSGIEFDKNFANVVRTSQVTGKAVAWLKDQFLELQGQIPVAAADLATIGTLGAQMGVAATDLARFTEVTAKFSATSATSVDEAATALSRLDQLLPDVAGNYERLASTILLTGVNAVATEQQIVRGTSQIAAMGRIAGLTTPEIVALSSTLSSLGFSPELQRSIVTSSFSRILTATSTVTEKTEEFGAVLKMTGKEFQQAWNEDAIGTYKRLMQTIAGRGDAVTVLKGLGLASQRLTPNLLKLGQNTEVLDEALRDTQKGWRENTELSRQYGIISDTVAARIQVLGQAWDALLVTLDQSSGPLKFLLQGLTDFVNLLRRIAKNPALGSFVTLGSAVAVVAGLMVVAAGATAALAAGYIAINSANVGMIAALAAHDAELALNTGLTTANTVAKATNAEVTAGAVAVTGGATAAVGANSLAMVQNTAATGGASMGMLRFSSGLISVLPRVLGVTTALGLAAAAAVGLGVVVASMPGWLHDMDKALLRVSGPMETVRYNARLLRRALDDENKAQKNRILRDQKTPAISQAKSDYADTILAGRDTGRKATIIADLEEEILALDSLDAQLKAVNDASVTMGISQKYLLRLIPGVASVLGDQAEAMLDAAEATEKLEAAQALWAASLNTTDQDLGALMKSVTTAAGSFLDLGATLTDAFEGVSVTSTPEQFTAANTEFIKGIDTQIVEFEKFYADLGTLVQNGGVQLATLIASQGTEGMSALTASLTLTPDQIAHIEDQMSLAAFYASDAFAETFAQNNSVLALVWEQSGRDPKAVEAFNEYLNDIMKGGAIDPTILAGLMQQFGITDLPVGIIPDINDDDWDTYFALAGANITPIKVPVTTDVGDGTVTREVDAWIVEINGKTLTMQVDPNTDRGRAIVDAWLAEEKARETKLPFGANLSAADAAVRAFAAKSRTLYFLAQIKNPSHADYKAAQADIATGGVIKNRQVIRKNYPAFARGTILRGPGTGTSDSILARVSNGEAITQARAVRYYGSRMMEDINRMRFPKFAAGGIVGRSQSTMSGPGTVVNATVIQNYPTTQDPIKKLRQDAESVIAGIWA